MCNLYDRIKSACESRGIRVSAMCLQLGMSKSVLSDLKAGRKKALSSDSLSRIAEFLQVSTDYLLGKQTAADSGAGDILDAVDIAFYGEFKELNEQEKEVVRDMVRVMRARRQE